MNSNDHELEEASILVDKALVRFYEEDKGNRSNPYEGMCYVASIVLKNLVKQKVILWKVKDHNRQFHWWCETKDGEVIDLTKQQYELNNISVPSSSQARKLKEQGRRMSFASYKKKEIRMMEIVEELLANQESRPTNI